MYMRGMGQFDTTTATGIDTSGVSVSDPTGSQVDAALNAIAQSNCLNTPGSIWNPTTKSCVGDGSGSFGAPPSGTGAALIGNTGLILASVGILAVALIAGSR